MQQVIRSDKNLVFGYTADHFAMGIDLEDAHLNEVTAAMVPVEGPNGARWQLHKDYVDMTDGFSWFITDKCENKEAAFKVGDFLMGDESSMVQMYGKEGSYWGKLEAPTESTWKERKLFTGLNPVLPPMRMMSIRRIPSGQADEPAG